MLTIMCLVLVVAASKWVWLSYEKAPKKEVLVAIPTGGALNETRQKDVDLFEKYQYWLSETCILEAARNAEGALRIAAGYWNVERSYDGEDHFGSFATYVVQSESGDSHYKVRVTQKPSLWTNAARDKDVGKLIHNCNWRDAVVRGPLCKHAAACLLVEHRVMKIRMVEEAPEPEEVKPLPNRGKWLLDGFKALKGVGRLNHGSEPAAVTLALPAPPLERLNEETQTEEVYRAPRMRRSVWGNLWKSPVSTQTEEVERPLRSVDFLGGPEAQDKAIELISTSKSYEPIRLMGFTFDYQPLVAALCTAQTAEPNRIIIVVLDSNNTLRGQTKNQNPMARQLLHAGVRVRLAKGKKLTPVYQNAGRDATKLGSLMGILHAKTIIVGNHAIVGSTNWTVSSRANQECSVCLLMDVDTTLRITFFFDAIWNNAQPVTTEHKIEAVNERLRVQALRAKK